MMKILKKLLGMIFLMIPVRVLDKLFSPVRDGNFNSYFYPEIENYNFINRRGRGLFPGQSQRVCISSLISTFELWRLRQGHNQGTKISLLS